MDDMAETAMDTRDVAEIQAIGMGAPPIGRAGMKVDTGITRRVFGFSAVIIAAVLVGTVIPGIVTYAAGVFYLEDLKRQLPNSIREEIAADHTRAQELKRKLEMFDESIVNAKPEELSKLTEGRAALQIVFRPRSNVKLLPFYLNPIMLLWSWAYICICTIAFIGMRASGEQWGGLRPRGVIVGGASIYLFYQWPLWIRNFLLGEEGRTVYSFANFDISPAGFFVQEGQRFCSLARLPQCSQFGCGSGARKHRNRRRFHLK